MIVKHDRIVLTEAIPSHGLEAEEVGTLVFIHESREGFEFVTLDGATSQIVEVTANQVRPVSNLEIPHARLLAGA